MLILIAANTMTLQAVQRVSDPVFLEGYDVLPVAVRFLLFQGINCLFLNL